MVLRLLVDGGQTGSDDEGVKRVALALSDGGGDDLAGTSEVEAEVEAGGTEVARAAFCA